MITIRKHQVLDYVTQHDLDKVIGCLKWKHDSLRIMKHTYEIEDKYKQLHLHAVVYINRLLRYIDNNKFLDFKIHWSPVTSLSGAIKYITKDSKNRYEQEQILITNYYNHNYGFI